MGEGEIKFEECGLCLGFINYPFPVDGKDLFHKVFEENLFPEYKNGITKYLKDEGDIGNDLYSPRGYRLFGNYGLLVISLFDEFAFCDRVFHANNRYLTKVNTKDYQYSCKLVTGISSYKDNKYIEAKAKETFLKKDNRYPFVGVNKLKVNTGILEGKGYEKIHEIKEQIKGIFVSNGENDTSPKFDSLVLDSFDNDELIVISFSNNINRLCEFFEAVRRHKLPNEKECIFTSVYTHIGYDVEYSFNSENLQPNFLKHDLADVEDFEVKVICEAKIGCREKARANFCNRLCENSYTNRNTCEFNITGEISFCCDELCEKFNTNRNTYESNITGGNTFVSRITIEQIHVLENLCKESCFSEVLKRLKVVLSNKNGATTKDDAIIINDAITETDDTNYYYSNAYINEVRTSLEKMRVNKIQRGRLIKIFNLYNDSLGNSLQAPYLQELHGALCSITRIISEVYNAPSTKTSDIDDIINELITSLEEAYYNRFHQKDHRDVNLEYNGGIQQHITSFDFAYKKILRMFQPERYSKEQSQEDEAFISVSGYERVTSTRVNVRININHITYPELFAICIWKEAANYHYIYSGNKTNKFDVEDSALGKDWRKKLNRWNKFLYEETTFINLKSFFVREKSYNEDDEIYCMLTNLLDKETVEYFLIDAMVFHFGFNRNYELFYYFYLKYFLQVSQHYDNDGNIYKEYFIPYLLRLFMVGFLDPYDPLKKKINPIDFLQKQQYEPFDPILSDLWFACFGKVFKFAEKVKKRLNNYRYEEIIMHRIALLEFHINQNDTRYEKCEKSEPGYVFLSKEVVKTRRETITDFAKNLNNAELICYDKDSYKKNDDFIIILFNLYLQCVKDMSADNDKKLKVVPLDSKGKIKIEEKCKCELSNLLSHPLGGMFIANNKTRGKYFACRTAFYKSLWGYTMQVRKYN